jgi:hypothetical protein
MKKIPRLFSFNAMPLAISSRYVCHSSPRMYFQYKPNLFLRGILLRATTTYTFNQLLVIIVHNETSIYKFNLSEVSSGNPSILSHVLRRETGRIAGYESID